MYNLLVSCEREGLRNSVQAVLDEEAAPLELLSHTVEPSQIGARLFSGQADILFCDAAAARRSRSAIAANYKSRPELCVIILGTKAELLCLQDEMGLSSSDRLRFVILPAPKRELRRLICNCTYFINDARLAASPELAFDMWRKNRKIVRERFWYDLISGRFNHFNEQQLLLSAAEHDVQVQESDKLFLPLFLRVRWEAPRPGEMNNSDGRFAMQNMMEELFEVDSWSIPIIALSPSCFAIVWHYRGRHTGERAESAGLECVKYCKKYLHRDVEFSIGRPSTLAGLSRYSNRLFIESSEPEGADAEPEQSDPVLEIKQFVDSNICRPLSRRMIAEHVYLNSDYMATLFKEKTGVCLSSYIAEKKMAKARHLLIRDGRSISEVATALGYTNFSYFSRLFKQTVGLTPSEYRQKFVLGSAGRVS